MAALGLAPPLPFFELVFFLVLPFFLLVDFDLALLGSGFVVCFSTAPGNPVGAVEVELELVVELVLEDDVVVDVVVLVVVDVPVPDEQTWVTERTVRSDGTREEIGTPSGTLNVRPPAVVTFWTQLDAPTEGVQAARPATDAAAMPTRSFRLLNTVAFLLPPVACSWAYGRDHKAA